MKKTQLLSRRKARLSLSRETIQVLNDPALLELARGGHTLPTVQDPESTSGMSEDTNC